MSTRRRANGEGSIYRRNSTGQWVAAITVSGTVPLVKRTRTAKTRAEANRLLRQLQAEVDEGPLLDDNRITIADWCHQWCDTIAQQNAIPATVSDYYYTLDHFVLPHLGGYRLNELTPRHIAEFQNALIASGKTKGTVRHARSPLSAALNHAVRCSMIRTNPCAVVPQPRRDNKVARTKKSLTYDEAQRLLDATRAAEPSLRAFVEFGLYRGPRRGEILGLKWADIDDDAGVIRIRRRLREERLRAKDGTYVVRLRAGEPKTPKSQRDLSLRGPIGATIRALRADQNRRRLAAGTDWGDSGYLFTTTNGDPVYPSNMYRRYKKLLADNGLPDISFHALRRTWATLSQEADIRLEQAQEALGHSRIETTKNVYVGAVPVLAQRAFDAFDDYLDVPRRSATRRKRDTEET